MATDELGQAADEYTRYHIGGMQPVETIGDKVRAAFIAGAEWKASRRIGHNHPTRDIKPLGQCPACDEYHNRNQEGA